MWYTFPKSSIGGVWILNGVAHYSPGYHMLTTWVSHAHLMGITCTPHGYHMHTTWISHAHLIDITCTPHRYHMHTTWVSHAHLMGITCTPHGYHMLTTWISHAQHMGITCTPHGYHMHTSWVSHAHLMGITCTPHGYHMHIHLEITLPLWYTFPKSSTGGVWISNAVAHVGYLSSTAWKFKPVFILKSFHFKTFKPIQNSKLTFPDPHTLVSTTRCQQRPRLRPRRTLHLILVAF